MITNWKKEPIETAPHEQGIPVSVFWNERVILALYLPQLMKSLPEGYKPVVLREAVWLPAHWNETLGWTTQDDEHEIWPTHWMRPAFDEELVLLKKLASANLAKSIEYGQALLMAQRALKASEELGTQAGQMIKMLLSERDALQERLDALHGEA